MNQLKQKLEKFLIYIGYLSTCCKARVIYNENWDVTYCSVCNKKIR